MRAPSSEQLMDFDQQRCMFFWGKLCFQPHPFSSFRWRAQSSGVWDPVGMMGRIKRFLRRLLRGVMPGACVAKRLHGPSATIKQACLGFHRETVNAVAEAWAPVWSVCMAVTSSSLVAGYRPGRRKDKLVESWRRVRVSGCCLKHFGRCLILFFPVATGHEFFWLQRPLWSICLVLWYRGVASGWDTDLRRGPSESPAAVLILSRVMLFWFDVSYLVCYPYLLWSACFICFPVWLIVCHLLNLVLFLDCPEKELVEPILKQQRGKGFDDLRCCSHQHGFQTVFRHNGLLPLGNKPYPGVSDGTEFCCDRWMEFIGFSHWWHANMSIRLSDFSSKRQ